MSSVYRGSASGSRLNMSNPSSETCLLRGRSQSFKVRCSISTRLEGPDNLGLSDCFRLDPGNNDELGKEPFPSTRDQKECSRPSWILTIVNRDIHSKSPQMHKNIQEYGRYQKQKRRRCPFYFINIGLQWPSRGPYM